MQKKRRNRSQQRGHAGTTTSSNTNPIYPMQSTWLVLFLLWVALSRYCRQRFFWHCSLDMLLGWWWRRCDGCQSTVKRMEGMGRGRVVLYGLWNARTWCREISILSLSFSLSLSFYLSLPFSLSLSLSLSLSYRIFSSSSATKHNALHLPYIGRLKPSALPHICNEATRAHTTQVRLDDCSRMMMVRRVLHKERGRRREGEDMIEGVNESSYPQRSRVTREGKEK